MNNLFNILYNYIKHVITQELFFTVVSAIALELHKFFVWII